MMVTCIIQVEEMRAESLEAYERDLQSASPDSSVFESEPDTPRSNVLSTFVDGVLGKKRKGDVDLLGEADEPSSKRPQVSGQRRWREFFSLVLQIDRSCSKLFLFCDRL